MDTGNLDLTNAELSDLSPERFYDYHYGKIDLTNLRLNVEQRKYGGKVYPHANVTVTNTTKPNATNKTFSVCLTQANISRFFSGEYDKFPFNTVAITFPKDYTGSSATIKFLEETLMDQIRDLCKDDKSALGLNYDPRTKDGPSLEKVVNGFIRKDMNSTPGLAGFYASVSLKNIEKKKEDGTTENLGYGAVSVVLPDKREVPLNTMKQYRAVGVPTKVTFEVKVHKGNANIRAKLFKFVVNDLIKDERDDGTKAAEKLMGNVNTDNIEAALSNTTSELPKPDLSGLNNVDVDTGAGKISSPVNSVLTHEDASGVRDPDDNQ